MKAKIGKMRATVSYANYPGPPCVEKNGVVIVTIATNQPPEAMIDVFVARVDNPNYSIGVTYSEVEIVGDCIVCDVCGELSSTHTCEDCDESIT